MFKQLSVNIDSVDYDPNTGYTRIIGWGINPVTKNPLKIESSIPALINSIERVDINDIFQINRDADYGFIIQFPGDVKSLNPQLTFSDGAVVESDTLKGMRNQLKFGYLSKAYKTLIDQGLLKKRSEAPVSIPRSQPETPFQAWIETVEPELWIESQEQETEPEKKISFIVTAKNQVKDLEKTIASLEEMRLPAHEIILAATNEYQIPKALEQYPIFTDKSIGRAINRAVNHSSGDFISFLDNGDTVSPHFTTEVYAHLKNNPDTDFIYSDSDKITPEGERYEIHFKPNYDETFLQSHNYILQPVIVSRKLFDKINGFRANREGLQNYDFILRATRKANNISHLPKILYHWQAEDKKISKDDALLQEYESGKELLKKRFGKVGKEIGFDLSEIDYVYELNNRVGEDQKVSIIIGVPEGFDKKRAEETVDRILNNTDYPDFEIITVNLNPRKDSRVKWISDPLSTTKGEIYNAAAAVADSDYLLFLEPGFMPVETAWLDELLQYGAMDSVGITAPYFFDELYQIRQAGIAVEDGKRKAIGEGEYCLSNGYDLRLRVPREVYAVGDECLLIRKKLFEDLNGFDMTLNPNEMDIDLSLRAREKGLKVIVHNNIPAMLEGNGYHSQSYLPNLVERYPESALNNSLENVNLKDALDVGA